MKLKFFLVPLALLLSTNAAFAQFFPARTNVFVHPGQVSAQVFNPFYEPIVCNGQIFGQTAAGPVFSTFLFDQLLPPGTVRVGYLMGNPYNPFVGGWSQINCRFLRWF